MADHDFAPRNERSSGLRTSLGNYAFCGGAAAALLNLVELLDLNIRLAPSFQSVAERAMFCAYFSLNLVGGLVIGLAVGLMVNTISFLARTTQRAMARGNNVSLVHKLSTSLGISAIAALLLNQQPQVHGHIIEMIREAEKFESLRATLLNHELSVSYAILMAVVVGCSALWKTTNRLKASGLISRAMGIAVLMALIAIVYYVDSRFETPLYAVPLHRSLFLLCTALSFSLIAVASSLGVFSRFIPKTKVAGVLLGIVVVASTALTFVRLDHNQNLKTLLFYRTAHAKQYFKLAQWILDFDRDGYSSFLGGGDCDDSRADINPGRPESVGELVDRNCIGGALTQQDIVGWQHEFRAFHRPADPSLKRLNVIYIFIDALRPDHLGAYGYARKTSPNLDKLAARSSLFENAYTPAPNTFEALPKFTQGAYWDAHLKGWPEIMAANGYNAFLFPRRISTLLRHVKGMKVMGARDGGFRSTIDSAVEVLGKAPSDRPFCAYLYSTDTHRPYKRHEEFYYGDSLIDLYDGEISFLDSQLGRLFDWMDASGRMRDTMIVVMADHGESLGERGVYKHSTQLYDEQMRVPMIVYVPGLAARSIKDFVSTIDLGPSMLEAVGLEYPSECAGVSLLPLMRGEAFEHPPLYGEQTTHEVSPYVRRDQIVSQPQKKYMIITQDGFKLIFNRDHYAFELFDLTNDPSEVWNLYDQLPGKAAELRSRLGRYIDVVTASRPWDADESQYFFGPTGEPREAK